MAKASDNVFPKIITAVQASDPSAPVDGSWKIYSKPGGIYARSSNGVVGPFGTGGAPGSTTGDRVTRTAGDLTTTSTTFVDATGMSVTVTTGAHKVLIGVTATGQHNTAGDNISLDIDIDGSRQGGSAGLMDFRFPNASYDANLSFVYMSAALSAASHTFKLQWKVRASGTGTLKADSVVTLTLWVQECPF